MGEGEIALILMVIVLFFGSKSIPTLAKSLGKGLRELKDATQNIQKEIENSVKDVKKEIDIKEEINKNLKGEK